MESASERSFQHLVQPGALKWWWGEDELDLNVTTTWEDVFPEYDCFLVCVSL